MDFLQPLTAVHIRQAITCVNF